MSAAPMAQFRDESTLHPSEGARFLLERVFQSEDQSQAHYRAVIFTPEIRVEYRARMSIDGQVQLEESAPLSDDEATAVAPWQKTLVTLGRLLARSAAKKRADALPPWPARMLRWRGPGRG